MMIPLKIEDLLAGEVVEQSRVEYKEGWNPEEVIHTICAFANDYCNVNGGYIVLGVATENGIPLLPPIGIPKEELDDIQLSIFEYCNKIHPRYLPLIDVVDYMDTGIQLIYMKCSAGDSGPYQAPVDVYGKTKTGANKMMAYWIRPASLTVQAKQPEIAELFDKFNSVPFDDRVCRKATLDDISRGYVEEFIRESGSALVRQLKTDSLEELLYALEVANETDTTPEIRNIGVLMFSEHPEKFIPEAKINLVHFHSAEAEASRDFTEKVFTGPIWKQIKDALAYINSTILTEKVVKIPGQAEAERFYNWPYSPLEEAVVNAVFHKLYQDHEPVEIRIYTDSIMIINYPGPARWVDMEKMRSGRLKARKYRNRRIGEMLKQLHLSEKESTGIPTMIMELEENGSPAPKFETDDERTYLITTLMIHEGFQNTINNFGQKNDRSLTEVLAEVVTPAMLKKMRPLLEYLSENRVISPAQAVEITGRSERTTRRYLNILADSDIVEAKGNTNNSVYELKIHTDFSWKQQ